MELSYTLPEQHGRRPNIAVGLLIVTLITATVFLMFPLTRHAVENTPPITLHDMSLQVNGLQAQALNSGAKLALEKSMKAQWEKLLRGLMAKVKSGKVLSKIEIALLQQIMDVINRYDWSGDFIVWIEWVVDMIKEIITLSALNEMQLQNAGN